MEQKNIYKALTSIIAEVTAIGKNQKNQQQGFMFRGIDDVMNELHTLFGKYKVVIIPEVVEYKVDEHTTAKGTIMYTTRSTVKFHFVADDGSEVVTTNVGEAMDTADKGMNKTMSGALKYALMQMFLIPTKDIVDADIITPENTVTKQFTEEQKQMKDMAMKDIASSQTIAGLEDIWKSNGWLHTDAEFKNAVINKKKELQ